MSSGGVKGGARVSIPSNVKKTIENIKEITGQNHTDDEIYAMLKECSMDPNETVQKLLALDTFHEVKRKKDKRKEIVNKDAAESKFKQGNQARANRGRGNYSPRYTSQDAGGGRHFSGTNENASRPLSERGNRKAPLYASQETKKHGTSSSSIAAVAAGQSGVSSRTKALHGSHVSEGGGVIGDSSMSKSEEMHPLPLPADSVTESSVPAMTDVHQCQIPDSSNSGTSIPSASASGSYFSSSDPVLLRSQDLPLQNPVGTIRREVREVVADSSAESKQNATRICSLEVSSSNLPPDMPSNSHGVGQNQHLEPIQHASSTTVSRPSSNYNSRSQVVGPQKVGFGKEWKPKSTNSSISQGATFVPSAEVSTVSVGNHPILQPDSVALTLKDDTTELQRKLEESHISDRHVIIPNHIHVPEAEKLWFCFGSFDASFGLDVSHNGASTSDKTALPEFESSDESAKGILSSKKSSVDAEDTETKHHDQSQSPTHGSKISVNTEVEVSPSTAFDGSKQQVTPGANEHPVGPTSNYNINFMPAIANGQLTSSETSESQAHDVPRLPIFAVQQPINPANYSAQYVRDIHAGFDNSAALSHFLAGGAASKYNGNGEIVSAQSSQSPQESGGPHVLSTASPTPLVTQAAGVVQSSINTPPSHPIFRQQPPGIHLPHYPPNYVPYGHYFPPFYVPPPMHQFLSNGPFPQQPPIGNLYPAPHGATAKYPVSQQKQGSNTGNSTHVGLPGSYAPYGLSMPNYSTSSATAASVTSSNEDRAAPQVKDNNIYASGQQNEGSGVWYATPSRDISTLQASSFYNLPQGQLAFAPTQPGHGTFPGMFHLAQGVTAASVHPLLQHSQPITSPDVVGPTATVYQQPQHPQHQQLNWPPNNY